MFNKKHVFMDSPHTGFQTCVKFDKTLKFDLDNLVWFDVWCGELIVFLLMIDHSVTWREHEARHDNESLHEISSWH